MIKIKRIYEDPENSDGYRVLVDHIWPRGVSKEKAKLDEWCKGVVPSSGLRKWFDHDPEKFLEFRGRFRKELDDSSAVKDLIQTIKTKKTVTLVYAAKDEKHNNAVVLQEYLKKRLK